jgi:cyclopropane-fatty-acyl-phospholipid synthase
MAVAEFLLGKLIRKGRLRILEVNGSVIELGSGIGAPHVTIRLHKKGLMPKLIQDFTLNLGEAYMDGSITIEEGSLADLLALFGINAQGAPPMPWQITGLVIDPLIRLVTLFNALAYSKRNVAHHYDLSTEFFKLFLDKDLGYTCAYFTHPDNDIDTAERDKKKLIASKLLLKEGMHILDIGCGWGGMAIYLAKTFAVQVTGITLSEEQRSFAIDWAKREGLEERVNFVIRDYREERAVYDRVIAVGMLEHVGLLHYREFFTQIKALLKDDGIALVHAISPMDGPGPNDNFLLKYIFPGGYTPSLSEVTPVIEKSGLWITDIELLRMHYAETLRCWLANFNSNRETIKEMYDEKFCRMWEFYLTSCEMYFRHMVMMVFQIQIAKNKHTVPLTRDYMFKEMSRLMTMDEPLLPAVTLHSEKEAILSGSGCHGLP